MNTLKLPGTWPIFAACPETESARVSNGASGTVLKLPTSWPWKSLVLVLFSSALSWARVVAAELTRSPAIASRHPMTTRRTTRRLTSTPACSGPAGRSHEPGAKPITPRSLCSETFLKLQNMHSLRMYDTSRSDRRHAVSPEAHSCRAAIVRPSTILIVIRSASGHELAICLRSAEGDGPAFGHGWPGRSQRGELLETEQSVSAAVQHEPSSKEATSSRRLGHGRNPAQPAGSR